MVDQLDMYLPLLDEQQVEGIMSDLETSLYESDTGQKLPYFNTAMLTIQHIEETSSDMYFPTLYEPQLECDIPLDIYSSIPVL